MIQRLRRLASLSFSNGSFTPLGIAALAAIPIAYVAFAGCYPKHDSLLSFEHFAYVYSSFRSDLEMPLWSPYVGYGQTTSFPDLVYLGAPQYFAIAVGALLGLRDLDAFCLSVWASQVVYLSGLFLLSRELRVSSANSLLLIACASLLTQPLIQPDYNWGISWPLCLACWLTLRLFRTRNPAYLAALAAFSASFLLFGHLTYGLIVQLYFLALWSVCCVLGAATGYLRPQVAADSSNAYWSIVLLVTVAVASTALFFWKIGDIKNNYFFTTAGRDAASGHVQLETFLTFGGFGDARKLFNILAGSSPTPDFSLFVGKILVALALVGAMLTLARRGSDPVQRWFTVCALFLVFIVLNFITPLQSPLASWAYRLPGMPLVRHIAYFGQLVVPLILLLAAIGVQQLSCSGLRGQSILFTAVAALAFLPADRLSLLLAALAVPAAFAPRRWAALAWGAAIVEICAHQGFYGEWELIRPQTPIASLYQSQPSPTTPPLRTDPLRSATLIEFATVTHTSHWLARYALEAEFVKEDYCYPSGRLNLWLDSTILLLNAIDVQPEDPPLKQRLYGCGTAKVEAFHPDLRVASLQESVLAMHRSALGGAFVSSIVDDGRLPAERAITGTIRRISYLSFSPNVVRMSVEAIGGPALIVFYDARHPWWTATQDGRDTTIFPANIAFKSILVADGVHQVVFSIGANRRFLGVCEFVILCFVQIATLWLLARATLRASVPGPTQR
jgi:hypothetical protein